MQGISYDRDGKLDLTNIYNEENPVSFFSALSQLDYRIPEEGKSIFKRLIDARREATGDPAVRVLDVGCSYGVNAALLKFGRSMDELYRLYRGNGAETSELISRDRKLFAEPADQHLEWVGLDQSENAIAYALEIGLMDAGIATDLERCDLGQEDVQAIGAADMIISTGCIGYVTAASMRRLLDATVANRPWMVHFVLRMFSYDPIRDMAHEHGYVTEKLGGLFPQRRFVSAEERAHVLANLDRLGIDARGAETSGWYFAELHVTRPEDDAARAPLDALMTGSLRAPVPA